MRPLKLEISAFCSYSGKTVIDMEKLGENGIYLITGDTGAGKTTIFDAITYALYGSPSGSNRDSSMLRSMYAPIHTETYVKLTFCHNGRTYIIERNPTHERAKKEGGKPAKLNANAEMYEISDGEEKNIASGTTKVTDRVTNILGIDHKQFCHIAMIAQGDFIKLLTAKSDERQKIFRKLFDTELYNNIQNILSRREKAARDEYRQIDARIKQYISGAECDENDQCYEEFSALRENCDAPQAMLKLIENVITSDKAASSGIEQKIKDTSDEIDSLNKTYGNVKYIISAKNNLEASEKKLSELEILSEQYKNDLTEKEKLKPRIQELSREIAVITAVLPDYSTREEERRLLSETKARLEKDSEQLEKSKRQLAELSGREEAVSAELLTLEKTGEQREKLKAERAETKNRVDKLTDLLATLSRYRNLVSECEKMQEKYLLTKQNALEKEAVYNAARNAFLDAQAGILAESLEDNAPCRVCGSLHHPSPAAKPENAPTQEQLDKLDSELKTAVRQQEEASTQAAEIKATRDSLRSRAEEQLNALGMKNSPDSCADEAEKALDEAKDIINDLEKKISEEEQKEKRKAELVSLADNVRTQKESVVSRISELEKSIAAGKAEQNARISAIERLSEKLAHDTLNEAEKAIAEKTAEMKKDEVEIASAQKKCSSCDSRIATEKGRIEELKNVIESNKGADTEKNYEGLLSQLESQRDTLSAQKEKIATRITVNENIAVKTAQLMKETEAISEKCRHLSELNEAVGGNITGQNRLTLEAYVQAVYFERIISHANMRLDVMSGGQYSLKRKQTGSSMAAKCGLDLEIHDHFNGTCRDVGSLSGGESFKASLALALGLADEIQSRTGGVKLDTMFIDEGFGSLDGTSLDQAMEALSELSGSNRLVGIISHVEELKRRIDKKIIVTKTKPRGEDDSYGTEVRIEV